MALHIIDLIINAVKKIHSKGIIHRDISPDNIFISSEDAIKVFDFGAAQLNDSEEGKNCEKVIKVGYSAPEQYRDKSNQGFYTDIYSVGAILYQMLTGIKPMESTEREHKDTLKSPLELGIKIEPNIDRAIMEAMAVQPELRFQNIQQFEDALHSKKIAEYPNVKLKKKKQRRNWIIGAVVAAVLAFGVGFGLVNTVFKTENPIFESQLKEGEIEVWVEDANQKKILTDIVNNNFHQEDKSGKDQNTEAWLKENQKIKVNIVNVQEPAGEGSKGTSMEEALAQAKAEGKMPDMFITDHVEDLSEYDLVSLEDNICQAVQDKTDEYLYLEDYSKYYRDMKEMPTGINTLFLYSFQFDMNVNSNIKDSTFTDSEKTAIDIEKVMNMGSDSLTMIPSESLATLSILQDGNCYNDRKGLLQPDDTMITNLYPMIQLNERALKKPIVIQKSDKTAYAGLYGNSAIADGTFRAKLKGAVGLGSNSVQRNALKNYGVQVMTSDDHMLIQFKNTFAISADGSKNEKYACMRLLWTILGEVAQKNYFGNDAAPFPINANSFKEYFDYNSEMTSFKEMVSQKTPCIIIGKGNKALTEFGTGLQASFQGGKTMEGVKQYCQQYSKENQDEEG